jgi:hypothetical protein
VLLVLIHLRTNLTTRALATLFDTSQSAVDRIIHHLVPVLARTLRPDPDNRDHPWIIDGTLIPVHHHQSITAINKNYRLSVNAQIIICSLRRRVVVASKCRPGNRTDVVVARSTVAPYSLASATSLATVTTAASPRSPHLDAARPAASLRPPLSEAPKHQTPRRTRHRSGQRSADTLSIAPARRHHQPLPPNHRLTLEPQDTQSITGQLLARRSPRPNASRPLSISSPSHTQCAASTMPRPVAAGWSPPTQYRVRSSS